MSERIAYTVAEVAQGLGYGNDTSPIYKMISDGVLEAFKPPGRRMMIAASEVRRMIDRYRIANEPRECRAPRHKGVVIKRIVAPHRRAKR